MQNRQSKTGTITKKLLKILPTKSNLNRKKKRRQTSQPARRSNPGLQRHPAQNLPKKDVPTHKTSRKI